jgi:hypothetical protein
LDDSAGLQNQRVVDGAANNAPCTAQEELLAKLHKANERIRSVERALEAEQAIHFSCHKDLTAKLEGREKELAELRDAAANACMERDTEIVELRDAVRELRAALAEIKEWIEDDTIELYKDGLLERRDLDILLEKVSAACQIGESEK